MILAIENRCSQNWSWKDIRRGGFMPVARIIDETGRTGLWTDALHEVLATAGYGMADPSDDSAGLTVLLHGIDDVGGENQYPGDLLVLSIPLEPIGDEVESSRTEVMGSVRLKARHQLSELGVISAIVDEIRPLVKLFIN